MGTEAMRAKIAVAYPGQRWADKVKKMPANQVRATYMRMVEDKKLDPVRK